MFFVAASPQKESADTPTPSLTMTSSTAFSISISTTAETSSSSLAATNTPPRCNSDVDNAKYGRYSTFVLFPKLPLELRRIIWVESFPQPRSVDLLRYEALQCPSENSEKVENTRKIASYEARAYFPVTLSVNQESRAETLRHYVVVAIAGTTDAPYFMNPEKDRAYLPNASLNIFQNLTWEKSCWLSELGAVNAAKCLSRLDAAVVYFHTSGLKHKLKSYLLRWHEKHHHGFRQDDIPFCCLFEILPGLKQVAVVLHTAGSKDESEPLLSRNALKMSHFLCQILEDHKDTFSSRQIPKIMIGTKFDQDILSGPS
ncbi:hypothetical protein ONS95_000323 [Cadophora gregata]|uniref:uncharacterized protein n=1 Tax=Cadophora gregata TaxID=51156 RepID=UPI0026DAE1B3|nr:uncharacterized protein ONS95_000323 [Cadophora gregata]KAK0125674.1 hypothetical protein ONS96_009507 [Cadophora gregata f. sp. sojae]KAK0128351.1 hypothetical protein ONS95_000323 [Cadophora gregata]